MICWTSSDKKSGVRPICNASGRNVARVLVLLDRDPPICRLEFRGSERGKTWQMVSDDVGKRPAIDLDAGIRQEIKEAIEDFERAKRGE